MASLVELVREHTALDERGTGHLQRLLASSMLLADLSFSDVLLLVPVQGKEGPAFMVVGQTRPATSQTLYREDLIGRVFESPERPLLTQAWRSGQIVDGERETETGDRARLQCIPVRWDHGVLGILTRESALAVGRRSGELERTYLDIFEKFARMINDGEFPFATQEATTEESPRVGDGVMVLSADGLVEYVSPNAVSALHRIGIHTNAQGAYLADIGFDDTAVRSAVAFAAPVTGEVERGADLCLVTYAIPLLKTAKVDGAVMLVRDISDLRRRDRLLLSKDAAIREVHHRVKNNLQTISSVLRLQGRRLASSEARAALEESVRRIGSIALVHETLSRAPEEKVPFDEIVRPLVRTVEEGLLSPDRPVRFEVDGDAGDLPADVATPLAVVLTELLQNAVDHAFPAERSRAGLPEDEVHVRVQLKNEGDVLTVRVHDDGVGLPAGFTPERSGGLGLTIVRTLVAGELGGRMDMRTDGGTLVELTIPLTRSGRR